MAFLDDLKSTYLKMLNPVKQGLSQIGNAAGGAVNNAVQYFNPESNKGNNFWSASNPVSQSLVNLEQASRSGVTLPKVTALSSLSNSFANRFNLNTGIKPVDTPVNFIKNAAINLPAGIAEGVINAPARAWETGTRLGWDAADSVRGYAPDRTPLERAARIVSDVSPLALGAMDVSSFGAGKQLAKEAAKKALKTSFLKTVGEGALKTGGYMATRNALEEMATTQQRDKFDAGKLVAPVASGFVGGALLGGGLAGGSYVFGKLMNGYKQLGFNDKEAKDLSQKHFVSSENVPVKFKQPKAQREFNAKINTVLGRPLDTPVFSDDLKTYQNKVNGLPDTQISAGLSVKKINRDKSITPSEYQPSTQQSTPIPQTTQPLSGVATSPALETAPPISPSKSVSEISDINPQVSSTPYFNTSKLNISDKAKNTVKEAIDEAKPMIEQVVGKKLSNKEVIETANLTAKTLNRAVNREQTKQWEAALLNARQQLAKASENGVVDEKYLENLATVKSLGTDIARKLQSFSIGADPKELTSKQAILEAVLKTTDDTSKILEAAKGVDFNDFNQASQFYRQFVKPNTGDWLDLLRYNSMLSSPNTHINNFASNLQGSSIITPVTKTVTGTLDAIKSALTGSEREYLAGEGPAYLKGYVSSLSQARQKFADVMSGKALNENPDIRSLPLATKGAGKVVEGVLSYPMKLLEASDQFFTTLAEGGLKSSNALRAAKGIKTRISSQDEAAKILFRGDLGANQGSHVLNAVDTFANTLQRLKASDNPIVKTIAKYTFPFVKTPTNVLKQGLEYSPLGVSTLYGATNKTEQLAKSIMGLSMATGTAMLLGSDRLTWSEPTDAKKKAQFRAAGMQPYSIKIGNNWVSYSKLHPAVAFNMALVSALKNAEDSKKLGDNEIDTVLRGMSKWWQFFADQSFVKNIGDFVSTAKGDVEGAARYISNYPQQLIPFRALMGWVERLTDPYQRKVDPSGSILEKQLQQVATQIPGLAQTIPARTDNEGKPIENQNRVINAFSPLRITTENAAQRSKYDEMVAKSKQTSMENQVREKVRQTGESITLANGKTFYKAQQYDSKTGQMKDVIKTLDPGKVTSAEQTKKTSTKKVSVKKANTKKLKAPTIAKITIPKAKKLKIRKPKKVKSLKRISVKPKKIKLKIA